MCRAHHFLSEARQSCLGCTTAIAVGLAGRTCWWCPRSKMTSRWRLLGSWRGRCWSQVYVQGSEGAEARLVQLFSGKTCRWKRLRSRDCECSSKAAVAWGVPGLMQLCPLLTVARMASPSYRVNKKLTKKEWKQTYNLSRLRCMSLSVWRMFGVWFSKSSRNSVRRSAARLYFSFDICVLSWSSR